MKRGGPGPSGAEVAAADHRAPTRISTGGKQVGFDGRFKMAESQSYSARNLPSTYQESPAKRSAETEDKTGKVENT